jgi:DNA polymerase III epsilon subunit-like protein
MNLPNILKYVSKIIDTQYYIYPNTTSKRLSRRLSDLCIFFKLEKAENENKFHTALFDCLSLLKLYKYISMNNLNSPKISLSDEYKSLNWENFLITINSSIKTRKLLLSLFSDDLVFNSFNNTKRDLKD